jgi:hypothetical protein
VLKPGATVTVAGAVTGSGDDRTISRVKDASLVYQAPRADMVDNLRSYETTGIVIMVVGALGAMLALVLIVRGARLPPVGGTPPGP